ncbi:unnamed protein product [Ectocarpus sp. 4 AP-2014]
MTIATAGTGSAPQHVGHQLLIPNPGSFGKDRPLVHRVLKVRVCSCNDQTFCDVLVTEHGRRVHSRPLRPTRHHLHVRLSSRFKKARHNLHVPTHSGRIN